MGKTGVRRVLATLLLAATLAGCALPAELPTATSSGLPWTPSASPSTASVSATPSDAMPSEQLPPAEPTPPEQPSAEQPPAQEPPQDPCAFPDSLRGKDLEVLPTSEKVVALTFDAGANGDGAPKILAALAEAGIPATFFLTGAYAQTYPDSARTIAATYPVGNHSMTHPGFTTLSDDQIASQLGRAEDAIKTVTGIDPRPLFRFPSGDRNARTISVVNEHCYTAFRWTVDTLGWKGTSGGQSADSVYQRVMKGLKPGAIVLMHIGSNPDDGSTLDADALPRMIDAIRAAGYGFVTLRQFV